MVEKACFMCKKSVKGQLKLSPSYMNHPRSAEPQAKQGTIPQGYLTRVPCRRIPAARFMLGIVTGKRPSN